MRRYIIVLLCSMLLLVAGCATTAGPAPSTEALKEASDINTQIGIIYLKRGNLELAMRKLKKALRQDAENADAHMTLAVVYEKLDKPALARKHYQRAVNLEPKNSEALNNYGQFLCEQGEYERAQHYFQRAAANPLYETPQVPLANAGICALQQGDRKEAESFFLRALKHAPRFPLALFYMAKLRFNSDQLLSARGYYQRYLAVASQTPETLWLGIRLEQALGNEDAVASYKLLLKHKFPDSKQTRRLLEWENKGKI